MVRLATGRCQKVKNMQKYNLFLMIFYIPFIKNDCYYKN